MNWRMIPTGDEFVALLIMVNATEPATIDANRAEQIDRLDVMHTMAMFAFCTGCTTVVTLFNISSKMMPFFIVLSLLLLGSGWLLLKLRKIQINDLDRAIAQYERKLAGKKAFGWMAKRS
jgi:hypothetical protein